MVLTLYTVLRTEPWVFPKTDRAARLFSGLGCEGVRQVIDVYPVTEDTKFIPSVVQLDRMGQKGLRALAWVRAREDASGLVLVCGYLLKVCRHDTFGVRLHGL